MGIFRFNFNSSVLLLFATITSSLFCSLVNAQNDVNWQAKRIVDSFCFSKHYGGYMLQSILPDGRLRLTAEARSIGSGRSWGLELLITSDEIKEIWLTSLTSILEVKEIERAEVFCNPENTILKIAVNKSNYLISKPRLDQALKQHAPGFPVFPSDPDMQLTQEEQQALDRFRSNQEMMIISKKISEKVNDLIWSSYLALGVRVRHIPYKREDHPFAPLMKPITLIEKKGSEK
jgi:hypothetical protein